MRPTLTALALSLALPGLPAIADGHAGLLITGEIMNRDGEMIGSIAVQETASGLAYVSIQATGISEGVHGVHLHETGQCEGDFSSAGGHISGDANHGLVEGGPHPGDLPNARVEADGLLSLEAFKENLSVADDLMDADGAAFIIHSGPDDYVSQPSGAAGDRIACAVLTQQAEAN